MAVLSRNEWKELLSRRFPACVSMYVPLAKGEGNGTSNAIRLKNAIREAERQLKHLGLRRDEAEQVTAPAWGLLANGYLQHRDVRDVAGFLAPGFFRAYPSPFDLPERVQVAEHFDVGPLVHLVAARGTLFYVLAVSRQANRLLACTAFGCNAVDLSGAPAGLEDVLLLNAFTTAPAPRAATRPRTDRRPFVRDGRERQSGAAKGTAALRRYLQAIDKAVCRTLYDQQAPLVFAGVEDLFARYRTLSRCPNLIETCLPGNPDEDSPAALREAASRLVEPYLQKEVQTALARYRQAEAGDRGKHDVVEVVTAASQGQVDLLLVDLAAERWGRYDPDRRHAEPHDTQRPGDVNLIGLAAAQTYAHGGTVYRLPDDRRTGQSPVAAVLRDAHARGTKPLMPTGLGASSAA